MKLLYRTAEWHALAKLRMHTDATLDHLQSLTKDFGILMRHFRDISSQFQTVELPRELAARHRQDQRVHAKTFGTQSGNPPVLNTSLSSRKHKSLNLFTPKFHFLGDYVQSIRTFGGTDSFSTQIVCYIPYFLDPLYDDDDFQGELAHRTVKQLYGRSNKRNATKQIGRSVQRLERAKLNADQRNNTDDLAEDLGLDARYCIPNSQSNSVNIFNFVREHSGDPAIRVRLPFDLYHYR